MKLVLICWKRRPCCRQVAIQPNWPLNSRTVLDIKHEETTVQANLLQVPPDKLLRPRKVFKFALQADRVQTSYP